ncbi:GntR family transcriptional regulator [Nocardioides sp. Arc9.136]|uniref:GntR family transcriptional regulator n=1 Tax=Nocardioides sp. Arc9.136 TaxID=2996826 RepID=UPI002666E879|nr:GntR family transcriptional regulator [Nocardioides sp. Arc9.136]WKN47855.1 GntR family transcriptional regulator [Nocardioides sp. Arc9.136]
MQVHPLDAADPTPPFEQLRAQLAGRVAAGDLPAGTRLPTVRGVAAELGLAVNTVAKAYRALEADGVVVTEGRRGTFVASRPAGADAGTRAEAERAGAAYVAAARRAGLTLPEAVRLVEGGW